MKINFYFISFLFANAAYNMYAQDTTKARLNGEVGQAKEEFKPSGKIYGMVFGDYYYKQHADFTGRGASQYSGSAFTKGANAFEARRIYLGYNYDISEKFSADVLLAYEGQYLNDGSTRTVYVKGANIRWKNICKNTDLVIGQMQTPSFPMFTEKVWNYRSVEKTILDMRKLGNSNDAGIALQGKVISNDKTELGYNLMIGNGSAAKIETDKFKKMYGDVYAKVLNKKIIIDLYGDYERTQLNPYHKSKMTMKFLLAYQSEKITVGLEAFQQMQEKSVTYKTDTSSVIDNAIAMGVGGYVRGTILKDKLNFFVRSDMYNPDTKFNADNTYTNYSAYSTELFFLAGLDYMPMKNVHIIPNIWYNSYSNRKKNVTGLAKNDYDMVARITVHYIFK